MHLRHWIINCYSDFSTHFDLYAKKYVSPVCRAYNLEIENAILSGSVEKNDNKTIDGNLFDTNKKANSIWQDMDTESNCGTAMGW